MVIKVRLLACAMAATAVIGGALPALAAEVNVYSARKEHLIKPLLDAFTEQTGITVNLLTAKEDQLLERLKSEGANSPADVFITTDVARLHAATKEGLLQSAGSEALKANIPAKYRDPEGRWYGLSMRARVIFYAKDRVDPKSLSTYEDLADPKWKGRICIRSSGNVYNQSLLASLIAAHGAAKAEEWAKGMVANLARKPQGGDRDQIKAVAAGECDIAVANTYYYGGMLSGSKADEKAAAEKVGIFFPNQDGRGTHVNVSGAGVTKSAKNIDEATKLLEFLSSGEAQRIYAEANNEYPVKPGVPASALVASWGEFKSDDLNVAALGDNNAEAVMIFDRVGWR